MLSQFAFDYPTQAIENSMVVHADCFDWLHKVPENSIHAIVTDPPYGVKEYEFDQLQKKDRGRGGIWRIPPTFDGNKRSPLPRFTALSAKELTSLRKFFLIWAQAVQRVLRPGGHVFLASSVYLSQMVFNAVADGRREDRGEVIRLVRTLRGGDRPKNAERRFPDVCTLPRGCYEPWGLFRKRIPRGMTVSDCLDRYQTGGLRRLPTGKPFNDVIESTRTPQKEREIANHPSLKPQAFLRQIVYAALPLGDGIVLDPFMGSGSTIAAANAIGYSAIGIERYQEYYALSLAAIPKLAQVSVDETELQQLSFLVE
jgi:site-specific DNA-methyltransferase (adenine-specific)